jgi:hypothetical protein
MTRWKKRLVIVGIAGAVVSVGIWFADVSGLWTRWFGEHYVSNALIGQTEDEVRREYGAPKRELEGYHALGLQPAPPEPISDAPREPASVVPMKTLIFKPRGPFHLERGTYWVWFVLRNGVWVCSESCWFADDVHF